MVKCSIGYRQFIVAKKIISFVLSGDFSNACVHLILINFIPLGQNIFNVHIYVTTIDF